MKIADAVELATKTTQDVLEDMVRTSKRGWNFGTMITCYRGEDPVAMLVTPPNRNKLLQAAILAVRGFAPDLLALTHDTFIAPPRGEARVSVDPRTGKLWDRNPGNGPGPMQTYVDERGYDGTVVDALVTHAVNRAGDAVVVPRAYAVEGKKVTWPVLEGVDAGSYLDDGVQEVLVQSMAAPTLDQVITGAGDMPEWATELLISNPERARWTYDMVTTTFIEAELTDIGVALFARKGTPRDQMLKSRFPKSQIKDPGRWN